MNFIYSLTSRARSLGASLAFFPLANSNTCGLNGLNMSPQSSDLGMRISASHLRYKEIIDVTISICNDEIFMPGVKFATLIFKLIRVKEKLPLGSKNKQNR